MKILCVGDLHCPADRPKYLKFCKDLYSAWDCDTVIFIGDVIDWTSISFWAANPECPGPKDEYELAKKHLKRWSDAFPKAKVCIGNHDERPQRLARSVKIPEFMIKPYNELWEAPGWEWDYSHVIDKVLYRHGPPGRGGGGIHPAWNVMNKVHTSVVIGHCHSRAGVKWSTNPYNRFFAMDVGCGIDDQMMQFAYGHDAVEKSILAAGIILAGTQAYVELMPCSKGEKYHDERK